MPRARTLAGAFAHLGPGEPCTAPIPPVTDRLTRIADTISQLRQHYLHAVSAGHAGEADWLETRIDRLLWLYQRVQRGDTLTADEETLCG